MQGKGVGALRRCRIPPAAFRQRSPATISMEGYGWGSMPASWGELAEGLEQGSNRRFDETLGEQRAARQQQAKTAKAQLDMQYKIAKLNAATERERIEVERWYNEQRIRLAEMSFHENIRQFDKTFGLNEGDLTGWYQDRPTLEREKFGLDVLTTAAEMRSRPDMVFQFGEFARNFPALIGGNRTRDAAVGSSAMSAADPTYRPSPQTPQNVMADLGYLSAATPGAPGGAGTGAPAGGQENNPLLTAIGNVYRQGFDKLGAQALEGMDPNELGFLKSGGSYLGEDFERSLRQYAGSRIGQSVGGG